MSRSYAPVTSAPEQGITPTTQDPVAPASMLDQAAALTGQGLAWLLQSGMGNTMVMGWMLHRQNAQRNAAATLDGLSALDEDARCAAVAVMDDGELEGMLDDLPADRQRELGPVFDVIKDPRRQLAVWERWHTAEAEARLAHDDDTRDSTMAEIADEVAVMSALIDDRKHEPGAVRELAERKSKELDIEARLGVNLTNNPEPGLVQQLLGVDDTEQRATWSPDALDLIDATLSSLPSALVADNPHLGEIRRISGVRSYEKGNTEAGEHGEIQVDDGSNTAAEVAHGVGRTLGALNEPLNRDFMDVAQWDKGPEHVVLPSSPDVATTDPASWAGAAGGPTEHFAEIFEHAVLNPEETYRDLVSAPRARAEASHDRLRAAEAALANQDTVTDTTTTGDLASALMIAQDSFDADQARASSLSEQFDLVWMRGLFWSDQPVAASGR